MIGKRTLSTILMGVVLSLCASVVFAQTVAGNYYGNTQQPGNRLHNDIMFIAELGTSLDKAIVESIDDSITGPSRILGGEAKSVVAFDVPLSYEFYVQMVELNSLIDVTKTLIEKNKDKTLQIITMGVVLYPDFVQEVFDGAALTGVLPAEDILVAAIQAGADPSLISDATAAGLPIFVPVATLPLGAGIGAGGTGGGDTTVSSN